MRSAGVWSALKAMRNGKSRMKGDERILGHGDFVETVLKAAQENLETVGILVNRNVIPFDPKPPQISSGIRLGTPAVTTRGFGIQEMKQIASLITKVLSHLGNKKVQKEVSEQVTSMCHNFPTPGID